MNILKETSLPSQIVIKKIQIDTKESPVFYTTIPVESLVTQRQLGNHPIEILNCMEQHMILLRPQKEIFCKEYLCDCTAFLQFDFEPNIL